MVFRINTNIGTELGNDDLGQRNNLILENPEKAKEMADRLEEIKNEY